MTHIIMKDGKERTVARQKLVANHEISYECPYCKSSMYCSEQSIFTRCDYGYAIWVCEKCNKEFRLCFQEIIEKVKKLEEEK